MLPGIVAVYSHAWMWFRSLKGDDDSLPERVDVSLVIVGAAAFVSFPRVIAACLLLLCCRSSKSNKALEEHVESRLDE